ncbi:MAG: GTA-gp10 family protein [Alphaproteobacteria bacterium]|jgi:hypothetical protein|nr:GTA-gp10 family protein [Alphaproteobacteria bacterium]
MTVSNISGEVLCTLNGKDYVLKPTFGALMRIELKADCSVLTLAAQALEGTLQVSHIATILKFCMTEDITEEELGEMILLEGLVNTLPCVHALMRVILEGTLKLDD